MFCHTLEQHADATHVAFRRVSQVEHPMSKHYPSSAALEQICKAFRLGRYVSTKRRLGGMFNVNLEIRTTKGTYVVRVMSGYATARHLDYVRRVMHALRKAGVPVVLPLNLRNGRHYATLGGRYVQVTRYIHAYRYGGHPTQIMSSGRVLRRFHDALKSSPRGPKPEWSNYPSSVVMKQGLARVKRYGLTTQYNVVLRLYQRIMRLWRKIHPNLPISIVHGDWHFWNQLFTPNGKVCCVLDFDFMQRGERLVDVGKALWHLLSNSHTRHLAGYFLKGYGPLTAQEYRALPIAIAVASLYELCTTPMRAKPIRAFQYAFRRQVPFLRWLLSRNGIQTVRSLYP